MSKKDEKTAAETAAEEKETNDAENAQKNEEQQADNETTESGDEDSLLLDLQAEVNKLREEVNQKNDQFLRKAAEFENLRKRTQRERVAIFEDAKIEAIKKFLPIYDDLERSVDAGEKSNEKMPLFEGVKMVRDKFRNVLDQYGVERIDETDVPFNVDLHDAMLRQPASDAKMPSDTVLQVLESGYKIGDRVIRHAKVIVSE